MRQGKPAVPETGRCVTQGQRWKQVLGHITTVAGFAYTSFVFMGPRGIAAGSSLQVSLGAPCRLQAKERPDITSPLLKSEGSYHQQISMITSLFPTSLGREDESHKRALQWEHFAYI